MTHLGRQQMVWKRIVLEMGPSGDEVGTLLLCSLDEFDALDEEE